MNPKFSGILRIDLTKTGEQVLDVSAATRLWLAKHVMFGGIVKANPVATIAIRIQHPSNDQLPWGLVDGYMNSFSGPYSKLYVTVINAAGATEMFLNTGSGVAGGFANTDGLSPEIGLGASERNDGGSVVAWL